ncbi:MAG: serine/threonine protein kinase [Sandaracinaceae bacterium]|nr:serine/threonine protein kinase [Sandaracinaceae bacterium]
MTNETHEGCGSCGAAANPASLFCVRCGAALHDDPRLGTFALGRYLLLEQLGAGGMGSVYRAEQHVGRFTRSVAVKILHPELSASPSVRARFEQECEVVVALTHPSTIRFFDFGELEDGALAIVMEHVPGETLAKRLERGPLPVEEALRVTAAIVGSLEEAHAAGVVHRDLKPENVMLYPRPGESVGVKVLDFGVAKRRAGPGEPVLTVRGQLLGTPAYMSPEQTVGGDLDARSDVYSLGLLVYEMLTGESPYEPAFSLADWVECHLHERPRSIDAYPAIVEALPAGARAALMSALAKRPEERPSSASGLLRALVGAPRIVVRSGDEGADDQRVTEPDGPRSFGPASFADEDERLVVPVARHPLAILALAAAMLIGFFVASSSLVSLGEEAMATRPAKAHVAEPPTPPTELALAQCVPTDTEADCETL